MPDAEPWTIGRLLAWTTQFLKDRGADSPRLDAEILLAEARDCRRIELYTSFDEVPDDDDPHAVSRAGKAAGRRDAGGLPGRPARILFAALSRHAGCADPRPETELLVVRLLDLMASPRPAESSSSPPATTESCRSFSRGRRRHGQRHHRDLRGPATQSLPRHGDRYQSRGAASRSGECRAAWRGRPHRLCRGRFARGAAAPRLSSTSLPATRRTSPRANGRS